MSCYSYSQCLRAMSIRRQHIRTMTIFVPEMIINTAQTTVSRRKYFVVHTCSSCVRGDTPPSVAAPFPPAVEADLSAEEDSTPPSPLAPGKANERMGTRAARVDRESRNLGRERLAANNCREPGASSDPLEISGIVVTKRRVSTSAKSGRHSRYDVVEHVDNRNSSYHELRSPPPPPDEMSAQETSCRHDLKIYRVGLT